MALQSVKVLISVHIDYIQIEIKYKSIQTVTNAYRTFTSITLLIGHNGLYSITSPEL